MQNIGVSHFDEQHKPQEAKENPFDSQIRMAKALSSPADSAFGANAFKSRDMTSFLESNNRLQNKIEQSQTDELDYETHQMIHRKQHQKKLMKCTRKNKLFKATPNKTRFVPKKSSGKKKIELENIDDIVVSSAKKTVDSKLSQENYSPNDSGAKSFKNSSRKQQSKNSQSKLKICQNNSQGPDISVVDMEDEHSSPLKFGFMDNDMSDAILRENQYEEEKDTVKQFAFETNPSQVSRKNSQDNYRKLFGNAGQQIEFQENQDRGITTGVKAPLQINNQDFYDNQFPDFLEEAAKCLAPCLQQTSLASELETEQPSGGIRSDRLLNNYMIDSEHEMEDVYEMAESIQQQENQQRIACTNVKADRFIPLRREAGIDNGEQKVAELQFEHEESVLLRFKTSQKTFKLRNKQDKAVRMVLDDRSETSDFQEDDRQGSYGSGQRESTMASSPGNSSDSKGSPNTEKNRKAFQNLLAQQCLGEDLLRVGNNHIDLSDQNQSMFLTRSNAFTSNALDMIGRDDGRFGLRSEINTNTFTDPFQNDNVHNRENLGAQTLASSAILTGIQDVPTGGSPQQSKDMPMFPQSRDRILKFNQPEASPLSELTSYDANPLKMNLRLGMCDWNECESVFDYASDPSQGYSEKPRSINKLPYKVLDAPQLQDDFYLNLVDWSSQNVLAVALNRSVYIWSACTSQVKKLCEYQDENSITSVAWSKKGNHLAIGSRDGVTEVVDVNQGKVVRTIEEHMDRISALAWNGNVLSTGSRDTNIVSNDLRINSSVVAKHKGHRQEVCGLKWSFDGTQLASGGNDNKLMIWNLNNGEKPLAKFSEHNAAVKAIAWHPNQSGLLASGGGTQDRCIRFWNTNTMQPLNYVDTGSQVCNLMFSKTTNELVSTHGYSQNQMIVWKYPTMKKVASLTGHTTRVLYLSMSPCGSNVVTGAGDDTLRFWNIFPSLKSCSSSSSYLTNSFQEGLH